MQEVDVLLVYQGEVVLELETELEPSPLIVVVLTGFAASFRTSAMFVVIVSLLRYHAQVFTCSVTRLMNSGYQ